MNVTIPNFFRTKSGKALHIMSTDMVHALCGFVHNENCVGLEAPAEDTKLCANCEKVMNEAAAEQGDKMLNDLAAQEPVAPTPAPEALNYAEYHVNFEDQGGDGSSYVLLNCSDRAMLIEAVAKIARRVPADRMAEFLCDVAESAAALIGTDGPNDLLQDAFKKRVRS